MKNDIIKIGCLETPSNLFNKQGYEVFSINGISATITADGGYRTQ